MKEKDYCLSLGKQEVSFSSKGRRMQMNVLRTKQVSHVGNRDDHADWPPIFFSTVWVWYHTTSILQLFVKLQCVAVCVNYDVFYRVLVCSTMCYVDTVKLYWFGNFSTCYKCTLATHVTQPLYCRKLYVRDQSSGVDKGGGAQPLSPNRKKCE